MRTIKFVSPTQLQLWENCPHLWYLRYVKKYKPPVTFPLKFGIAFHAGIEVMLDDWGKTVAYENACSTFDYKYTFTHKGEDPAKWMKRAAKMFKTLQNRLAMFDQFEVLEQEQMIAVDRLRGRIDCIAKVDGEEMIIDWKTSNRPFSETDLKENLQLTSYCYLTGHRQAAFMVVPKVGKKIYFQQVTRTEQQIREFGNYLESVIERMETLDEFPKNLYFCGNYGGCSAYKDGECIGKDDF